VNENNVRILDGAELFTKGAEAQETSFDLADIAVIEEAINETERQTGLPVKMIVIDPISNYWGDIRENNNAEVRSVLKPLARLAERKSVVIVSIQHTGKSTDRDYAQHRILGSTGIVAAHRNVWGVYPTENKHLLFAKVKANCCIKPTGVEYLIAPPDGQVQIIDCNVEKDGDDIEAENRQRRNGSGRPNSKVDDCVNWLSEFIGTDSKTAKEVFTEGGNAGYNKKLLNRAKEKLGIVSIKNTFAGGWDWCVSSLFEDPEEGQENCEDAYTQGSCLPSQAKTAQTP
jgi:hypothetical protein